MFLVFLIVIAWTAFALMDVKRAFVLLPFILPAYVFRLSIGPLPTTLLELLLLATVAAWLIRRKGTGVRDAWVRGQPWRIPTALWLLAGIIAVIVSPLHMQALGLFRAYFIEPLLVFWMGWDVMRTREDRERLYGALAGITIVLGAYAALQMLTGWGIPRPWDAWPGRRATGPFPFPNALALFVTPVAALAAARMINGWDALQKKWNREMTWNAATVIAGIVAILCARSDGAAIALGAAAFIALLLHRRTRWIAPTFAIIGISIIAAIPSLRAHAVQTITLKDWSGIVHATIWKETTAMLTDTTTPSGIGRPLFGAGLGAYPVVILPYHHATWMEVFQYPHQIFLNLWSELGALGLIAFAWIMIVWLKQAKNETMEQKSGVHMRPIALAVIVALLVQGLADVPYFKNDLAPAFWILILLTTFSHEHQKNRA